MSAQPDYVSFDSRGRDELLSQIGSFSPHERGLFQRLCDSWAPSIDAGQIIRSGEASAEQEQTALERLMAKLRNARIGVLTTTEDEEGVRPHRVVLTSTGSLEYWEALLDETIRRLIRKGFQFLPTEERVREQHALPPDYHIAEADSSQLVSAYGGSGPQHTIFRLRLLGNLRVLFTSSTAKPIVLATIGALKRDLSERGILEEIARIHDASISQTRTELESKAPDVWLRLTTTLVKERGTIAFRKNIEESDEIFQLGYLIMLFVDAQIGLAREQKQHEEVVDEHLERLESVVREAPSGTLSAEEFSSMVEEHQSELGEAAATFSRRLAEQLLTPRPRRQLPRIVSLHGLYMHGSRVRAVFEKARSEMRERLIREYTELMEAFLRGRSTEIGEVFSSRDLFNEDIQRRVERNHPLLAELIARPQLLAEAVIQHAKERREGASADDLKGVLSAYFDVDSSALRPLSELFAINIVEIFDTAFARVGVLRQILLRISGRHESLRASYVRRFGPRSDRRYTYAGDSVPPAAAPGGAGGGYSEPAGTRVRGTGNRGHRADTAKSERPRRAPKPPPKPKRKSHQEIEEIWKEFDKALHTRPRSSGDDEQ